MKTVFFYGTLKRGHYNYRRFGMDECKFLGVAKIKGYKMYTNGMYPAVVKSSNPDDEIEGEVFLMEDDLYDAITIMELSAGYHIDKVDAVWDVEKQVSVELFAINPSRVEKWDLVKDGVFKI